MPANLENWAVATGLEKVSFHSNPKKGQCQRMLTTTQLHSFHMQTRACPKSSKPGFNSKWTENFQMNKLGLEKAEEPEIKLPKSIGSSRKQENSRKTFPAPPTTLKLLTVWITTVWITTNCGQFLEKGIPDHLTCLLRNLYAGQEASYNQTWNKGLVPNWERSTSGLCIVSLLI